jgi:hypothetical protein
MPTAIGLGMCLAFLVGYEGQHKESREMANAMSIPFLVLNLAVLVSVFRHLSN